ncbi:MAG TPA: CD3324 family protein [Patescibacteria group bacterium]|nr:CD3324 family protein [Patescibacteria group bacterium]
MDYKNGKVILPTELLEQLQEYVQGNLIYIPKKEENRTGWGENSGAKTVIANRNHEICEAHRNGVKTAELAAIFCLSEDSIRKILHTARKVSRKEFL